MQLNRSPHVLQIVLSEQEAQAYDLGFWDAWRVEEDCRELADRVAPALPAVVVAPNTMILFALTPRQGHNR